MSKAFTRESDEPTAPVLKSRALPPNVKNYITPQGLQRLRQKLAALEDSPQSSATASEVQARHDLEESLRTAVEVKPPPPPWTQVLFGAIVTVRNQNGEALIYHIVGIDETDLEKNQVSWLSPVAKALLKVRLGDRINFQTPMGAQRLEIIDVRYQI